MQVDSQAVDTDEIPLGVYARDVAKAHAAGTKAPIAHYIGKYQSVYDADPLTFEAVYRYHGNITLDVSEEINEERFRTIDVLYRARCANLTARLKRMCSIMAQDEEDGITPVNNEQLYINTFSDLRDNHYSAYICALHNGSTFDVGAYMHTIMSPRVGTQANHLELSDIARMCIFVAATPLDDRDSAFEEECEHRFPKVIAKRPKLFSMVLLSKTEVNMEPIRHQFSLTIKQRCGLYTEEEVSVLVMIEAVRNNIAARRTVGQK